MTVALNATPIIAARLKGLKPSEMIRISLVGSLCPGNHTVHARPGEALDWRWTRDLDVCLYVGALDGWVDTLKAIALCRPAHLSLWFAQSQMGATVYLVPTADDVSKPVSKWLYELQFTDWMDFQNDQFARENP